ncbi:MAG: hypothetical protein QXJ72_05495 [Thermoproteota archaeon]
MSSVKRLKYGANALLSKMTRKRILAVVMLVATIIMAYGIINLPPPRVEDKNLNAELKAYNTITVTVKRASGSTETYVKKGDPWLRNFVALIANAFLGRDYYDPAAIYRIDGSTFTIPEWEYVYSGGNPYTDKNPYLKIGIGSSNTEVTFFDYGLGNLIATADVTSTNAVVSDNGTNVNMQFTASFSFSSSYTIREVGLFWYGYAFGSTTQFNVLLARDVISPISVGYGDAMSVTYSVSIPYSTPPIVKNFVALICNYIFGLKYYGKAISYVTTDGTSTTVMDIGHDSSTGVDNIKEKACIHIGQGDPIYRKDLSNIYSYVASSSQLLFVGIRYNSTHAWYIFVPDVAVTVAGGAVIREVGFIIDSTDIDGTTGNSAKKVLIMYFPLQNPINVPAGSGIKFNFALYLPLAPVS